MARSTVTMVVCTLLVCATFVGIYAHSIYANARAQEASARAIQLEICRAALSEFRSYQAREIELPNGPSELRSTLRSCLASNLLAEKDTAGISL